jgi:hypothetical protein
LPLSIHPHPHLQILSQSKNPLAVQPHLRKCFEAIESLDFAPDLSISAMTSREGERMSFDKCAALRRRLGSMP